MTALHSCGYASQIMMMIEKVSKIYFWKDHEMTDLKPQFLNEPMISMDVPSSSAAPSSSSSSGVLRVLKSMFPWCRDTCQRQDVILSNQRCLSEKMGINKFNEFPLPVPHLDDDPFTSLSTTDLTAIWRPPPTTKKATTTMKTKTTMSDLVLQAPSFPFLVP
jgi:hypothetical protein